MNSMPDALEDKVVFARLEERAYGRTVSIVTIFHIDFVPLKENPQIGI